MSNLIPFAHPPVDERVLLCRANALAGYTLGELSAQFSLSIPADLKRDKGWIGVMLERYLGVSFGNKPEQDFAAIGVELKTIPVNNGGRPLETTFVCMATLTGNIGVTWKTSYVRHKLTRVLWIPVEGQRTIPLKHRRIGAPFLWSPDMEEELQLRRDWEELMDLIVLGKVTHITARYGEVLQLRPKAANSQAMTAAIDEFGQKILTSPSGFYLKKNFTSQILARYFL
ncbi:DNA mismatch repair endonuclease MutH [Sodalis endosymbiont of Henestaris halophilus]|uniref:DNA mismatch repair endonuclease MutH n=1 Tax=Sodalis endosymbiont of Henestaris halophilus TaxID=1929246 RepID=UPI000BC0522E|nr:DNA mismatch repair endonuclease MutH [Sodalis endosymbiont of Henestaris halophilus]SNC58293.1 DNA mismatch repair protein MutH [Sodalis endosymbiont of Henestaris halophilus]